ncbi:MAG: hypothetical protein COZ46_03970 [Verrucomicrobia bacterium CG_4_10_14_3_um_filter_43_23]|nr:MAG: hypothetical protein COZ46_03970 [Verrucomicrobia bacterium CG_4_10_14_3_um_filter_43_23]
MKRYPKHLFISLLFLLSQSHTLFAETVRLATYNVQNYLITSRMVDGVYRQDYPKPEAEKTALRAIIKRVNPDVLALQEMGSKSFLLELQQDLAIDGINYPHYAVLEEDPAGRYLAVLSKIPFNHIIKHQNIDFKYQNKEAEVKRGLLEVTFLDNNDQEWGLFVLHLKSRWEKNDKDHQHNKFRAKEAAAIRNRIREHYPKLEQGRFVVLGDFNDHKKSKALTRFLKIGNQPYLHRLIARDSRNELWTYFYDREARYETIDFMLVSPELHTLLPNLSANIADTPDALIASDHRMLYVDLEFPDIPQAQPAQ